jgi:hypothetical protein
VFWRIGTAVSVLLAVAMVWLAIDHTRPQDHRPVTLPNSFAGVPRTQVSDFGTGTDWPQLMRTEMGTAPFAGATYNAPRIGTSYARPYLNVAAARGDFSGRLDLRMAGDDGTAYGTVRCTQHLVLPGTHDSLGDGKLLCWRTSSRLSISAFVLLGPADPATVAGGVEELWERLA